MIIDLWSYCDPSEQVPGISLYFTMLLQCNVNNPSDQGTFSLLLIFIFPFVLGWLLLCRPWFIICDIVRLAFLQTKHLHFSSRHKFWIYYLPFYALVIYSQITRKHLFLLALHSFVLFFDAISFMNQLWISIRFVECQTDQVWSDYCH